MSNTGSALVIKLVITFVAGAIAFWFIEANAWSWILLVSAIAAAANYLVGDLIVLPAAGNTVASIVDGVTAAVVAWLASIFIPQFLVSFLSLAVFAIVVAVAEYFFHSYLKQDEKVSPKS